MATRLSTDRSRKTACIIVDPRTGRIAAYGANTFPRGVQDLEERHERPEKYYWTEHAERNAVYQAAREGVPLDGCVAYLPWCPCMDCARALIQSGISRLVCVQPDLTDPKWGEDFKRVSTLFGEAGVQFDFIEEDVSETTDP